MVAEVAADAGAVAGEEGQERALGALIRRLIKEGHAEKTGRFGESIRPEAHRAIVFFYRGRIGS